MKFPILDSIINGCLNPQFETNSRGESIDYNGIARMLKNLPEVLTEIETVIARTLQPFAVFSYGDERPFRLDFGTEDDYIQLPIYTRQPLVELPAATSRTPKERFYEAILEAERKRTVNALLDYVNTAAVIDSRGEIYSTLQELFHLSKQIPATSKYETIFANVRRWVIQVYYQIAYMFASVLDNEKIEAFDFFYYSIYGDYPEDNTLSSLQSTRLIYEAQSLNLSQEKASKLLSELYLNRTAATDDMISSLEDYVYSLSTERDSINSIELAQELDEALLEYRDPREILLFVDGQLRDIENLHISVDSTNSEVAKYRAVLQGKKSLYEKHLPESFVASTEAAGRRGGKIAPKLKKTEVNKQKRVARKYFEHYGGYNLTNEKIMSDDNLNRLLSYLDELIEFGYVKSSITKIPQIGLKQNHIQHTFYLVHKELYGTNKIKDEWPQFICDVFYQFRNTAQTTVKQKWATAGTYERDVEKMMEISRDMVTKVK